MSRVARNAHSAAGPRVLAVGGLLLTIATLASVLLGGDGPPRATASSQPIGLVKLTAASEAVAKQLGALRPGGSAQPVRRAILAAMRERDSAARSAYGDVRVTNALDAQRDYLDALGSVLSNPRSRRAAELPGIARRLRAAFASLPAPGALPATVTGWTRALRHARARR
jgi:hypothetical protein